MARDTNHVQMHRLRELVLRGLDGVLSSEETQELDRLVQQPEYAREAASMLDQVYALRDGQQNLVVNASCGERMIRDERSVDAVLQAQSPTFTRSLSSAVSANWWWAAAALVLLLGSHGFVAFVGFESGKAAQRLDEAIVTSTELTEAIAKPRLVGMTACVWNSGRSVRPLIGDSFEVGDVLNLLEGIAEFQFQPDPDRLSVIRVEGPASIFVRSDGQFALRSGALTADVANSTETPFVFDTPAGELEVFNDASLGLLASGDVSEVHVFRGSGLLRPTWLGEAPTPRPIQAGEAIEVSFVPDQPPESVAKDASLAQFVSSRSVGFDPLSLDETYERAVLASDPAVYWRFQTTDDSRGLVPNLGNTPGLDAIIQGDVQWRRYGKNRVAVFGLEANSGSFVTSGHWPAEPLEHYAIECWMKPVRYHHGEMICLTSGEQLDDSRYEHGLLLEVAATNRRTLQQIPPNRIRFVHRSPASADYTEGVNVVSQRAYEARMWQHVVAQKHGDQLELWVNGDCVAVQQDASSLPGLMRPVVGQLYPHLSHRRFIGQIDEVALYEHALSKTEIVEHLRATKMKRFSGVKIPEMQEETASSLTSLPLVAHRPSLSNSPLLDGRD